VCAAASYVLRGCANVPTPAKNVQPWGYLRDRCHDYFPPRETDCGRSARFLILLYCRNFASLFPHPTRLFENRPRSFRDETCNLHFSEVELCSSRFAGAMTQDRGHCSKTLIHVEFIQQKHYTHESALSENVKPYIALAIRFYGFTFLRWPALRLWQLRGRIFNWVVVKCFASACRGTPLNSLVLLQNLPSSRLRQMSFVHQFLLSKARVLVDRFLNLFDRGE
jgi:hypothetical protein